MKKKTEIFKLHKEKIDVIKKHNRHYFEHDKPKISDASYDELKKEILDLEKKYPFLKDTDSVEKIVGSTPSNKFSKISHLKPMLSLSNAFDKNDMEDFLKKVNNFLNIKNKNLEFFSEPKIDGISATLIYENGILKKGYLEEMV